MGFGNLLETLVVVGIASAGVLNAVKLAIVVAHLVEQVSTDKFDGSSQSPSPNVYLMGGSDSGNPCIIPDREMGVGFGGTLDSQRGSCKFIFKKCWFSRSNSLLR